MANFRARLIRSFPIFRAMLSRRVTYKPLVKQALVAGAVAGAVAVTGILKGDELVSAIDLTTPADRTAEFVKNTVTIGGLKGCVAVDGYINNTGGTTTATHNVLVTWLSWEDR